jgi:outer membrane protein assembly factor BamD (BamD/ComL family)
MYELRLRRLAYCAAVFAVACLSASAQKPKKAGYDRAARATVLHEANVYVAANADGQRISLVTPGHEVVVVERSGPWVKVFANTDVADDIDEDSKPDFGEDENVTPASGWIRDKGVVGPSTPGGDAILFGAAANLEDLAEQPHAPKGAAAAAHLLYRRVFEYYPDSPLAPEAAWRSADVRWQLDRADVKSLPSAKEQEAYLRPQIYEGDMKKVMKSYPGTKFAAEAAYEMIDNKLCGDWQGLPKCPEMETGLYEKYAQQFPDSPKAPEALYNAAYRQGTLVTMYTVEENRKKADAAAAHTQALAQQLKAKYPQSDFAARAASIAYKVQQGIAIFGNDRD